MNVRPDPPLALKSHDFLSSPRPASPQRPNNAPLTSFSAPTANVCPPPSSATATATVRTTLTRPPAPNPPAALVPSSATTRCACRPSGAATETRTAPTAPTSGRRTAWGGCRKRPRWAAESTTSSVKTESVSTAPGGVTEAMTARIIRTSSTAVSWLSSGFTAFFLSTYEDDRRCTCKLRFSLKSNLCLISRSLFLVCPFIFFFQVSPPVSQMNSSAMTAFVSMAAANVTECPTAGTSAMRLTATQVTVSPGRLNVHRR